MKRLLIYSICALLGLLTSCSQEECVPEAKREKMEIEVAGVQSQTRVGLYEDEGDIIDEEFTLDAYLTDDTHYIDGTGVTYFQNAWRFMDETGTNLVDYYWPNDKNVNFLAYLPRDLNNCVVKREDIDFTNAEGLKFSVDMPTTIDDSTDAERDAENAKKEFIYACRLDQDNSDKSIKLRFVHPFAVVKFRLLQAHRNLELHSINLSGIATKGTYISKVDTYEKSVGDGKTFGQEYLTHENWSNLTRTPLEIKLEKKAPDDIDYGSLIGGPYLVIPQDLSDVKLSVTYSWDTAIEQPTAEHDIKTTKVPNWQPGKKYTYYLDLGDNKEEILFKVMVEDWVPGEDDDYENEIEVK